MTLKSILTPSATILSRFSIRNPPALLLQGPPGWEARCVQSLITNLLSHFFSIFNQQLINLYQFPMINQQLIKQLLINLLFAGLQVSKLVIVIVYCTPWTDTLPSTRSVVSIWGGPENQRNFNAYPIHQEIIKLVSQDLPKCPK